MEVKFEHRTNPTSTAMKTWVISRKWYVIP